MSSIKTEDNQKIPNKKLIMSQKETQDPSDVTKDFNTALKEMEERLNQSFTQMMKNMISPLQISVDSLVVSQKEWKSQKSEVHQLQCDKMLLDSKVKQIQEENTALESRVKKLEEKLMESNLIIHVVKESRWELDSTRHELVVQTIASSVSATNDEKKLEIARNIPISSTSRIGKYNSLRSRLLRVSFCKADAYF